jgi:hypothetical protein
MRVHWGKQPDHQEVDMGKLYWSAEADKQRRSSLKGVRAQLELIRGSSHYSGRASAGPARRW